MSGKRIGSNMVSSRAVKECAAGRERQTEFGIKGGYDGRDRY